jgi:hypothetical protein
MRIEYQKINPNVNINYQYIGSGGGVKQFTERTVDFGASDATLTENETQTLSTCSAHTRNDRLRCNSIYIQHYWHSRFHIRRGEAASSASPPTDTFSLSPFNTPFILTILIDLLR